jgi:hypothetical protein
MLLLYGHNFGGYMIENAVGVGEDSSLSQAPRELPRVASYWNARLHRRNARCEHPRPPYPSPFPHTTPALRSLALQSITSQHCALEQRLVRIEQLLQQQAASKVNAGAAHARLQRRVLQVHLKALGAVRSARAAAARRRTQQVARQRLNGW